MSLKGWIKGVASEIESNIWKNSILMNILVNKFPMALENYC